MVVKEETGRGADTRGDQASFWEISKHAWPILFERPKQLLALIAVLAISTEIVDEMGLVLQAPYMPYFEAFWKSLEKPTAETSQALKTGLESLGDSRLLWSGLLPCFLAPFIWLAMCHASLSIWDGWRSGLRNALFALRKYFTGLKILLIISLFAIFLFLFSLLSLLPLLLVNGMMRGGGQAAAHWVLTLLGVVAGFFFFIEILWPHLRRFLLLQFLIYFRLVDGDKGPWAGRIWRLYEVLRQYPSHMNQGVAVFVMAFFGSGFASSIVLTILGLFGVPSLISNFFGNAIVFLGLFWPFVALAGFHRLILSPAEAGPGSESSEDTIPDEPFPPMDPKG